MLHDQLSSILTQQDMLSCKPDASSLIASQHCRSNRRQRKPLCMAPVQPSLTNTWVLQKELGQLATEDIERVLDCCKDAKQIALLSVLHRWARSSPSGVYGHLLAWLQLAEVKAADQMEMLAAQLMAYNRLLGPGLLDTWLQQTTELAAELSEADRAAALCGCSPLEDAGREPASLADPQRLLKILGACRARAAHAALQKARGAPLLGAKTSPAGVNTQVSGARAHTAFSWAACQGHNSAQLMSLRR